MKTKERHISSKKKLIIGMFIGITLLCILIYFYHKYWNGLHIVNNIPVSITGVGIIFTIFLTFCTIFVLGGILLAIYFPCQPESEKLIKNLPNNFVNVAIKDFDSLPLSKFISKEDISCVAKLDEDGKVSYSLNITAKFHKTDDYDLFLKHFNI